MGTALEQRTADVAGLQLRLRIYPAGYVQPDHAHDRTVLNLVLSGALDEATESGEQTVSPWSLYVRPAGVMHRNRYGARPTRVLSIATAAFGDAPAGVAAPPFADFRWFRTFIALLRSLHDLPAEPISRTDVAALFRTGPVAKRLGDGRRGEVERALERGRAPIGGLARSLAMHRVSFSRAFRRQHGWSPREYRRWCRVRAAAIRIGEEHAPLSEVALGAGFADQSHMCRDFRRILGITPAEYRRLLPPIR